MEYFNIELFIAIFISDSSCGDVTDPDPSQSHPKSGPSNPGALLKAPLSLSEQTKYIKTHLIAKTARHSAHKKKNMHVKNVPYA